MVTGPDAPSAVTEAITRTALLARYRLLWLAFGALILTIAAVTNTAERHHLLGLVLAAALLLGCPLSVALARTGEELDR